MWYRRVAPFLAVALLAACGEPPAEEAPAPDTAAAAPADPDQEAIAELAVYWETHYNMQHPDMVASKYADSAWVAPADGGFLEGPEAIEGWLTEGVEGAPTADITPAETVIAGDNAMGIGTYSISTTGPDGNPMEISGAFMNALSKVDGEWLLDGSISNYDAPRPEGWEWNEPLEGDAPADVENEFTPVIEAFEAAYNAGDPAAIAALYTDDAMVAYSDGPLMMGPGQVEAAMAERMQAGATLVIHQLGTTEVGGDLTGSGGWYEVQDADGTVVQAGFWWNLMEMQEDGTPRIRWTVTNAWPMGV